MLIQTIRHRMHLWLQRPVGRMAGLLLLSLMVCSVIPGVKTHAHGAGLDEHGHHAPHPAMDGPSWGDDRGSASKSANEVALHVHDLPKPSTVLPALPLLLPGNAASSAAFNCTVIAAPLSTAPIPPYRPPIA